MKLSDILTTEEDMRMDIDPEDSDSITIGDPAKRIEREPPKKTTPNSNHEKAKRIRANARSKSRAANPEAADTSHNSYGASHNVNSGLPR